MEAEFNRNLLLKCFKELDSLLEAPLEILICGGAAGILRGYFQRATLDIDVLGSNPALVKIKRKIEEVAENNGLSPVWLNDGVKGFADYLPNDFAERVQTVEGNFQFLKVQTLSKVDLYVLKLSALRARDVLDLKILALKGEEKEIVKAAIEKIAGFDPKSAHKMALFIEEEENG